ncbi:hypothetical protein IW262DRAFT_1468912 [Armillaria fumosa]|nr:hypothetical protein IW262DRAFT_1468912 [Armillaria fumosa]
MLPTPSTSTKHPEDEETGLYHHLEGEHEACIYFQMIFSGCNVLMECVQLDDKLNVPFIRSMVLSLSGLCDPLPTIVSPANDPKCAIPSKMSFMSADQFCFRACTPTRNNAPGWCQHIYNDMGCAWNVPINYSSGVFESCQGDSGQPMGVYDVGVT